MSLQFIIYGFGLTVVYYIGIFFLSKKRKSFLSTTSTETAETVDHPLIVDSVLDPIVDSVNHSVLEKDTAAAANNRPSISPIEKQKEVATTKTAVVSSASRIDHQMEDSPNFPLGVFETTSNEEQMESIDKNQAAIPANEVLVKHTAAPETQAENQMLLIENSHEIESADFLLMAYENSIEKTHNVAMSELLEVLQQAKFNPSVAEEAPKIIDEKFINQVIEYSDSMDKEKGLERAVIQNE